MDPLSTHIARPQRIPAVQPRYRLRAVLEYYGGRKTWRGGWNLLSQDPLTAVWSQPKDGLAYALVEGEDINGYTTEIIRIPGSLYAYASWEVHSPAPSIGLKGSVTLRPTIHGLALWSTKFKFIALVDGTTRTQPLTPEEAQFFNREHTV